MQRRFFDERCGNGVLGDEWMRREVKRRGSAVEKRQRVGVIVDEASVEGAKVEEAIVEEAMVEKAIFEDVGEGSSSGYG
jgi:hypothetical protein